MPQGSPRVRVRIRRNRTEWAVGQRPVGSKYSGGPDVFLGPLRHPFHRMGTQAQKANDPGFQVIQLEHGRARAQFLLSVVLCCPGGGGGGVHCSPGFAQRALCPEVSCPARYLPLYFPGVGNQSCSVLFQPRRQCSLMAKCFYLGKEREVREVTFTEHP